MDDLDRLIARMSHLDARARAGALDEENATKLSYSEFGTATEPMRPTLSAATDRNVGAMRRAVDRRLKAVIDGKSTQTGQDILADVAGDLAEEVRNEIDGDVGPPLADSTLAARRRRGNSSERTLVDTGEMRKSIRAEAKRGTGEWGDE